MIWAAILGCRRRLLPAQAGRHVGAASGCSRIPVVRRTADLLPVALLAALVAVQVFGRRGTTARADVDARLAGLAAAFVALLLRAPFLVVVFVAALTAALIRLCLSREAPGRGDRARTRRSAGAGPCARTGPRPGPDRGGRSQRTLTALHAAATALYWVLPAPYRSLAAFSVAVRAPA